MYAERKYLRYFLMEYVYGNFGSLI